MVARRSERVGAGSGVRELRPRSETSLRIAESSRLRVEGHRSKTCGARKAERVTVSLNGVRGVEMSLAKPGEPIKVRDGHQRSLVNRYKSEMVTRKA
jgi:hypothetical protein